MEITCGANHGYLWRLPVELTWLPMEISFGTNHGYLWRLPVELTMVTYGDYMWS